MSQRIVIAGGSGFLGRHLAERLAARGDTVTTLTRGESRREGPGEFVHWDGDELGEWVASIDGADAVVHVTGKRVDCRPTRRNVRKLIDSRVGPVLAVGKACRQVATPPRTWVQLSSLAIHGDGGELVIDEQTPPSGEGPPQMVQVCQQWEAAFKEASAGIARTVLLRAAIAIGGSDDPASKQLARLARMGLGGRIGSGEQWMSWVALADFMDILLKAIDDSTMSGMYHVTSPNPIRNGDAMATYRALVGRDFGLPSPKLITTIGAWLLGADPALALTGRRAIPARLLNEGFEFAQPNFEAAAALALRAM